MKVIPAIGLLAIFLIGTCDMAQTPQAQAPQNPGPTPKVLKMDAKAIWRFVEDAKSRHLDRKTSIEFLQRVLDGKVKIVNALSSSAAPRCYYDGDCNGHQCAECDDEGCICSDCCIGVENKKTCLEKTNTSKLTDR
jgi:hypothetical protein